MSGSTVISGFDVWIERVAALRRSDWAGAGVGLALFAAGFMLHVWLSEALAPFPFLTFFPGIILTALLGGVRPALAITMLAAVSAWYFFIPPVHTFALSLQHSVGVGFFLIVAAIDITLIEMLHRAVDRGRMDRARAESLLATREAMFKELQHRVANNMQFTSGLLAMQQKQVEGTPAGEALAQAASRLRAMGRIHRRLYDPVNAERPFGQLVEELCHELLEATGAENIVCRVDIAPIALSPDRVHTLSMIVTEAMTNAVKHAFPDGRTGTIRVALEFGPDNELILLVADDGVGISRGVDPMQAQSLGMKIMQALAQQIDGAFSFGPGIVGTELRLRFVAP